MEPDHGDIIENGQQDDGLFTADHVKQVIDTERQKVHLLRSIRSWVRFLGVVTIVGLVASVIIGIYLIVQIANAGNASNAYSNCVANAVTTQQAESC